MSWRKLNGEKIELHIKEAVKKVLEIETANNKKLKVCIGTDSQVKGGVLLLGLEPGAQPFVGSVFESLGYRSRSAFDVAQVSDLISRDPNKWGFLLIDADTVSDEILKSSSQLLSRFEDLRILVMSATGRGQRAALPQSPRVAAVDKPLGVWNVEAVLQRLSHSIAVEPAME